jgi:hypothetical protein
MRLSKWEGVALLRPAAESVFLERNMTRRTGLLMNLRMRRD